MKAPLKYSSFQSSWQTNLVYVFVPSFKFKEIKLRSVSKYDDKILAATCYNFFFIFPPYVHRVGIIKVCSFATSKITNNMSLWDSLKRIRPWWYLAHLVRSGKGDTIMDQKTMRGEPNYSRVDTNFSFPSIFKIHLRHVSFSAHPRNFHPRRHFWNICYAKEYETHMTLNPVYIMLRFYFCLPCGLQISILKRASFLEWHFVELHIISTYCRRRRGNKRAESCRSHHEPKSTILFVYLCSTYTTLSSRVRINYNKSSE